MLVARNADDADICGRRVILNFDRDEHSILINAINYSLVSDELIAPQPVSPKFAITDCLRADQMCLLVISCSFCGDESRTDEVGVGHGNSSTSSQRFYTLYQMRKPNR